MTEVPTSLGLLLDAAALPPHNVNPRRSVLGYRLVVATSVQTFHSDPFLHRISRYDRGFLVLKYTVQHDETFNAMINYLAAFSLSGRRQPPGPPLTLSIQYRSTSATRSKGFPTESLSLSTNRMSAGTFFLKPFNPLMK